MGLNAGQITKTTDTTGTVEYTYGKLGEVLNEKRTIQRLSVSYEHSPLISATMGYQSDYLGRMETMSYPDGEKITYSYDSGGQVTAVHGSYPNGYEFSYVQDIGYNEDAQRVYIQYGNGVETKYHYNKVNKWLEAAQTTNTKKNIQNLSYRFDKAGNVLGYTNTPQDFSVSQNYRYDGLYQLTTVEGSALYHYAGNNPVKYVDPDGKSILTFMIPLHILRRISAK